MRSPTENSLRVGSSRYDPLSHGGIRDADVLSVEKLLARALEK